MQMLLLNQNKLMMQWLCGLMSADEAELRNQHRQLLPTCLATFAKSSKPLGNTRLGRSIQPW